MSISTWRHETAYIFGYIWIDQTWSIDRHNRHDSGALKKQQNLRIKTTECIMTA